LNRIEAKDRVNVGGPLQLSCWTVDILNACFCIMEVP
jgi:hypothetical protein